MEFIPVIMGTLLCLTVMAVCTMILVGMDHVLCNGYFLRKINRYFDSKDTQ